MRASGRLLSRPAYFLMTSRAAYAFDFAEALTRAIPDGVGSRPSLANSVTPIARDERMSAKMMSASTFGARPPYVTRPRSGVCQL